jgi:hypothetical protein
MTPRGGRAGAIAGSSGRSDPSFDPPRGLTRRFGTFGLEIRGLCSRSLPDRSYEACNRGSDALYGLLTRRRPCPSNFTGRVGERHAAGGRRALAHASCSIRNRGRFRSRISVAIADTVERRLIAVSSSRSKTASGKLSLWPRVFSPGSIRRRRDRGRSAGAGDSPPALHRPGRRPNAQAASASSSRLECRILVLPSFKISVKSWPYASAGADLGANSRTVRFLACASSTRTECGIVA